MYFLNGASECVASLSHDGGGDALYYQLVSGCYGFYLVVIALHLIASPLPV